VLATVAVNAAVAVIVVVALSDRPRLPAVRRRWTIFRMTIFRSDPHDSQRVQKLSKDPLFAGFSI
jgi:hypothetical protein